MTSWLVLAVACGPSQGAATATPAVRVSQTQQSPSPGPASPSPGQGAKLYTFAPEGGSKVGGSVQISKGSSGVTLTISVSGLDAGHAYLADADPLPCEIFAGGPSQSFPKPFTADAHGNGEAVWTVPNGMDGNANVQALTSEGIFAVLACADLTG